MMARRDDADVEGANTRLGNSNAVDESDSDLYDHRTSAWWPGGRAAANATSYRRRPTPAPPTALPTSAAAAEAGAAPAALVASARSPSPPSPPTLALRARAADGVAADGVAAGAAAPSSPPEKTRSTARTCRDDDGGASGFRRRGDSK